MSDDEATAPGITPEEFDTPATGRTPEQFAEQHYQQMLGTCVHFNGIQHGSCKAGVVYEDTRLVGEPGLPAWLPCLDALGRATAAGAQPNPCTCPLRQLHTPEQARAHVDATNEALRTMLTRFMEGTHCVQCGAELTGERKIGRSVYGEPCGCRMFQGQVRARWRKNAGKA